MKKYFFTFLLPLLFALQLMAQDSVTIVHDDNVIQQAIDSISNSASQASDSTQAAVPSGQETYLSDSLHENKFSKEEWKKATKGLSYNENSEKPKPQKAKDFKYEKPSPSFWTFNSGFAQILLIVIAAAVIGFVLYKLLSGNVSNTKVGSKKLYHIAEIEDALHESDLERFLREAIEKKEFRLAVRIYYLMAIKELSERNWIKWKKDKTNNQYIFEMRERPNITSFRDITLLFEYVWYGEMTVNETIFAQLGPKFKTFLDQLHTLPA